MKKTISVVLLIALALSFAACGSDPTVTPPSDDLDIPSNSTPTAAATSPSATPATGTSPSPTISIELPEDVDPSIIGVAPTPTPDENPEVTIDPNKTIDPKNTPVPASKMPTTLKEAKALNSDTIGWIKVPNTNIDYPIMYRMSPKKWYYNDHDFFKQHSSSGSIYSYYDDRTRNVIISGHNMRKSGTMFHELHSIQNKKDNLKTEKNRIFNVNIFGYTEWEVWALYETKESEPEGTLRNNIDPLGNEPEETEKWIAAQKKRSEIDLDVDVSGGDVLMTIITCGDNFDNSNAQSRLYFFLKAKQS